MQGRKLYYPRGTLFNKEQQDMKIITKMMMKYDLYGSV